MADGTPDFEADIELLATSDGGRRMPCGSGYRPHHVLRAGLVTSGAHEYIGVDTVAPGGMARARVTLLSPELFHGALVVGMTIPFCEGPRVVGHATVTRILDPRLAASR